MRQHSINSSDCPLAGFSQLNREPLFLAEERRCSSASLRSFGRAFLTAAPPQSRESGTGEGVGSSHIYLAWRSTVVSTLTRSFNTHRVLVGPRFSPIDF